MRRKNKGTKYIPYDYEAAFRNELEKLHELFREQLIKERHKAMYALKEITAGEQLEIEFYPEFSHISDIPEGGRLKKDNTAAQKNLNDKNAQKYLDRLINHNFGECDIWITLTYADGQEPETMEQAIHNMQNYIKRINYRRKKLGLPNARYVYITEYDPDAEIRWHHHLVMDGALDMDSVEKTWKKGHRNEVRSTDPDDYGLSGMSHYITKNKNRKKGEKRWISSTNLKQFRERKTHSKRRNPAARYEPIGKYVERFVKDQDEIERQLAIWYPEYIFTQSKVYYNDFNGMFYIHARMRKPKKYRRAARDG